MAIVAIIGVDELLLVAALTLVTVALWPWLGRSALIAPGVTMLWLFLPSRTPFIARIVIDDKQRKRT